MPSASAASECQVIATEVRPPADTGRATLLVTLFLALACTPRSAPPDAVQDEDEVATAVDTAWADSGVVDTASEMNLPPILMISIDTLRVDRLAYYGGESAPFLDGLLEDAFHLADHRSCSNWTYASVVCAMAAANPVDRDFVPVATDSREPEPLPDDWTLFGDLLRDRGYSSRMFSTNAFFSGRWQNTHYDEVVLLDDVGAEEAVQQGLAAIDEVSGGDEPWMVHLHFMDPHTAYEPPGRYFDLSDLDDVPYEVTKAAGLDQMRNAWDDLDESTQDNALRTIYRVYNGEVLYLDDQLEQLWSELDERGLLDELVVVFWSDHGEQFMEHGDVTHGKGLHREETLALAAFWGADLPRERVELPTTHADIVPTLFELLGWEQHPTFGGQPALEVAHDRARFAFNIEDVDSYQSVDVAGRRMIYRWDGWFGIYDLQDDPAEDVPLGAEQEDARLLWELLGPEVQRMAELVGGSPVPPEL